MDDQDQVPEYSQNPNQAPIPEPKPTPQDEIISSPTTKKVIQPSEETIKEIAADKSSYFTRGGAVGNNPVVNPTQPPNPSSAAPTPLNPPPTSTPANPAQPLSADEIVGQDLSVKAAVDPATIYPTPVEHHMPPPPSTGDQNTELPEDKGETVTFNDGYSIGGRIYFYQLLANIFLSIVFRLVTNSLKGSNSNILIAVSFVYLIAWLSLFFFIPYKVIKGSSETDEPFWLTLFSLAIEVVITVCLVAIAIGVILLASSSHSSSAASLSVSGAGAFTIVALVVSLVAEYFLVKLCFGTAFLIAGKIRSKIVIKLIGIVILTLVVGAIASYSITLHRVSNSISNSNVNKSVASQKTTKLTNGTTYTDPTYGYQIDIPEGWTQSNSNNTLTMWLSPDGLTDQVGVGVNPSHGASLQQEFQSSVNTWKKSLPNYKLNSSELTTINGTQAYYFTDTYTGTGPTSGIVDTEAIIEVYKNNTYDVSGIYLDRDSATYAQIMKQAIDSFKA